MTRSTGMDQAFSLLELIVVCSVVLVLSMVGMKGWHTWYGRWQVQRAMDRLVSTLHFARFMAMKQGRAVEVHHHEHGGGVLLTVSSANGGVLRQLALATVGTQLIWRGSFGGTESLKFNSLGFAFGYQGRYQLRMQGSPCEAGIVVSSSGRLRRDWAC